MVTSRLLEAFLACPLKRYLLSVRGNIMIHGMNDPIIETLPTS